jgi:transcriptional regulator with XRE-family HTH domain
VKTLGERLKQERRRLGLTQAEFARLAGVKRRAQFSYEKGSRSPNAGYLLAIEKAGADAVMILLGGRTNGAEGVERGHPGPLLNPTPLDIHFALRRAGSSLSDIARRASRGRRVITPCNVRGVLYGYMRKNAKPILTTIKIVLRETDRAKVSPQLQHAKEAARGS